MPVSAFFLAGGPGAARSFFAAASASPASAAAEKHGGGHRGAGVEASLLRLIFPRLLGDLARHDPCAKTSDEPVLLGRVEFIALLVLLWPPTWLGQKFRS